MTNLFEIAKSIVREHHEKMGYPVPFEKTEREVAQAAMLDLSNVVYGEAIVEMKGGE